MDLDEGGFEPQDEGGWQYSLPVYASEPVAGARRNYHPNGHSMPLYRVQTDDRPDAGQYRPKVKAIRNQLVSGQPNNGSYRNARDDCHQYFCYPQFGQPVLCDLPPDRHGHHLGVASDSLDGSIASRQSKETTRQQLSNGDHLRKAPPFSSRQFPPTAPTHSRPNPRQLRIQRKDGGFGFSINNYPPKGDPIIVKSIKENGPAVAAGLNIGDQIISVNDETVAGRQCKQVVQMIQNTRSTLLLTVIPPYSVQQFQRHLQNPEPFDDRAPPCCQQAKPAFPTVSLRSSSSRESSPFSSKTSDSNKDARSLVRNDRPPPTDTKDPQPHSAAQAQSSDWENPYETIDADRLTVPSMPHSVSSGSTEHVYAVPALAGSSLSSSTLGSAQTSPPNQSRDSLDSDSSLMAGFSSQQDETLINKIKKDCERKEEFLKNQTYPAYLSSPPKDIDTSPYGIASLANTMPPAPPKEEKDYAPQEGSMAGTKNFYMDFFMDIQSKELSKKQSVSKSSSVKKRNFDATQFNTYGLPLGYRRGGNYYDIDNFSRNNFVIIGSKSLHCEPPQVYQPTPEPSSAVWCTCYEYPVYYPVYCHACLPSDPPPCADCAIMTMTTPYQPRPPRPTTLPGLQSYACSGRHDSPNYEPLPPTYTSPVHMHPDPQNIIHNTVNSSERLAHKHATSPDIDGRLVVHRRNKYSQNSNDVEEDRNLRRVSYLQATKEERLEADENLATETGIAPTHSIKKLKSFFTERAAENMPPNQTVDSPSPPVPNSPREREASKMTSFEKSGSETTLNEGFKEGPLQCKVAVLDGKKATDRSWKPVYVVLKSKVLYMYKDKKMAQENLDYEETPVKLEESEVQVASDYTKRKNVFRVKTGQNSEYLFQAVSETLMKDWVRTIETAMVIDERKDTKLKNKFSFRNRSPTGQSPSSKTRKPSNDPVVNYKDKKNWKGKVVKQLKRMGGGGHGPMYPEGGSIGVPLEECPTSENDMIPCLVKTCCDIINKRGLEIIGIYRVPGNNAAVTYLTEQINKGVEAFAMDDQRWQDVNVVSSLLKSFFRKLPDPLFTVDRYSYFIEASKVEQPVKRLDDLRRLIRDLPDVHLETLRFLTQHLCNVAEHSSVNKMEIRNLAIVFGPTLVRTTDDNMKSMVTDMSQQCRIIESLLSNWEYFFADCEEAEMKEEPVEENILTGTGNQSVMLANLTKLEDSGKLSSPKGDVSAKDIVSSIISAANRKMLRTGGKTKKESMTDLEERSNSRQENLHLESRRESESVIHGPLQIASAVPGLVGSIPGSSVPGSRSGSTPHTPTEEYRPAYGSQGSRGSLTGDLLKRRGSLPSCQSKRGSICAYSGGAVCEAMPLGEVCESRLVMMKSDTEMIANGMDDDQQVVHGQLSLVNVAEVKETENPPQTQYKFPIETYTGLDAANEEKRKKFEAETIAMLSRNPSELPSRFSSDGQMQVMNDLQHSRSDSSLNSYGCKGGMPALTSVTTPVPDSDPLHGGILTEEPYPTDAYDQYPQEAAFLSSYRAAPIPSLLVEQSSDLQQPSFNVSKVAKCGTLQRLKIRPRQDAGEVIDDSTDTETEGTSHEQDVIRELTASFNHNMRLLLGTDCRGDQHEDAYVDAGTKKELDDVKNAFLRDRANKRGDMVNPEPMKSVLRQVNNRKPVKRNDSLTKKEKTEINLKTKEVEKENKVLKLRERFEPSVCRTKPAQSNQRGSNSTAFDIIKERKKLSDNENRKIKRRHTVGGTKDFTENLLSKMIEERSKSSWDRLVPFASSQELRTERKENTQLEREEREERRLSLPDCTVVRPIESHV